MYYYTIVFCLGLMPCDIDHLENAVHVEQGSPIFETIDECFNAGLARFRRPVPNVPEGARFDYQISCDLAEPPKPA